MFDDTVSFTGDVAWTCLQNNANISAQHCDKRSKAADYLKSLSEIVALHSLYSRGDEGHADHHQVQNIEVVSTE